jgi:bifunctional DNase/RNase
MRAILIGMRGNFVELWVHGVAVDPGEGMPVVILYDPEGRSGIPVPIGPFEASAIILELEGVAPPRPHTHDLLASFFKEGGFKLEAVELYGEPGSVTVGEFKGELGSPLARLVYRRGLRRSVREVRPSDGIALALRLKAPIRTERRLLRQRGLPGSFGFSPSPDTLFLKAEEDGARKRPDLIA